MAFVLVYSLIHIPCLAWADAIGSDDDPFVRTVFVSHFVWAGLLIAAYVIAIRDLYRRCFPNPNSKVTWALLILLTSGIGLVVYLVKHGFRPRTRPGHQDELHEAE